MSGTLEVSVPAKEVLDVATLDTAKPLAEIFQPYQVTLDKWQAKAESLIVTSLDQKTEMAQARLARLELKDARCTMEKTRKGLVEGLKARTGKIDGAARTIREKMEELEEKLLASEQFALVYEEKRRAELGEKRRAELAPLMDSPIVVDLSALNDADYAAVLENAKLLKQAKIDAAAKAEADRIAKEERAAEEQRFIKAENDRLKAEALEIARLAEIERVQAAKVAEDERKERAEEKRKAKEEYDRQVESVRKLKEENDARILEAEQKRAASKAEADAELKRVSDELEKTKAAAAAESARVEADKKAAEKAAKKAAAAPDKGKLQALSDELSSMPLPLLSNASVSMMLKAQVDALIEWIDSAADNL